jgi:hypothetical protein
MVTERILRSHVGDRWDKSFQERVQSEINQAAKEAADLGGWADTAHAIGAIGAALLDPRKWLLFLALIAGAGMTAWGGVNVIRSAR